MPKPPTCRVLASDVVLLRRATTDLIEVLRDARARAIYDGTPTTDVDVHISVYNDVLERLRAL